MLRIFDYDDYRDYLKAFLQSLPQKGYGKGSEIAQSCEMNPATLTLVLKKERDLTLDQASDVCMYLGISDLETEFFLTSVQLQRSGRPSLRTRMTKKLAELKAKSLKVKNRLNDATDFDDDAKSKFYSQWYFSAVRLVCGIPGVDNVDEIAVLLGLPRRTVQMVLDFLLKYGLVELKGGKFKSAVQSTHLPDDSFLVSRHHTNWRLKAIEKMAVQNPANLFFTSPVTIAKKDIPIVRELLIKAIEQIFEVVDPSNEEQLSCLNIDWFPL